MSDEIDQPQDETTAMVLDAADFAMAREQAASRGVDFETYVKKLLHRELLREAAIA